MKPRDRGFVRNAYLRALLDRLATIIIIIIIIVIIVIIIIITLAPL